MVSGLSAARRYQDATNSAGNDGSGETLGGSGNVYDELGLDLLTAGRWAGTAAAWHVRQSRNP